MAAGIQLAWDVNSEANIAGYRVYYGIVSRNYTTYIDVGNVTTYAVTNLPYSTTFFFAATAFNTAGVESELSVEASAMTALPPPLPPVPPAPPANFRITNILQGASSVTGPWTNIANTVYNVPKGFYRERMMTGNGSKNTAGQYVGPK